VDLLGDLQVAASQARELASMDPGRHARLVNIPIPRRYQAPQAFSAVTAGWLANLRGLLREGSFALAPWFIHIRD
jgi:hypothetical protein